MQIVAGAVKRIDDPDTVVIAGFAAFLAQKSVIGVKTFNFPYNFCFAGAVYFANVVVPVFAFNGNGIHVLHLAAHDVPGGVGSFDSDIEYRMRHVR